MGGLINGDFNHFVQNPHKKKQPPKKTQKKSVYLYLFNGSKEM